MTQTTAQASVTSQTIAVEHIRISSGRPFAEVRRKLEGTVPKLDTGIAEALGSGDQQRANDYEKTGPKLSIFGERDHGALLQIVGSQPIRAARDAVMTGRRCDNAKPHLRKLTASWARRQLSRRQRVAAN